MRCRLACASLARKVLKLVAQSGRDASTLPILVDIEQIEIARPVDVAKTNESVWQAIGSTRTALSDPRVMTRAFGDSNDRML